MHNPGATNSPYTNWLKTSDKHNDIDEVLLCPGSLNRMVISFDGKLKQEAEPVDHFTIEHPNPNDMIKKYSINHRRRHSPKY